METSENGYCVLAKFSKEKMYRLFLAMIAKSIRWYERYNSERKTRLV